jgi:hypothetical protein
MGLCAGSSPSKACKPALLWAGVGTAEGVCHGAAGILSGSAQLVKDRLPHALSQSPPWVRQEKEEHSANMTRFTDPARHKTQDRGGSASSANHP